MLKYRINATIERFYLIYLYIMKKVMIFSKNGRLHHRFPLKYESDLCLYWNLNQICHTNLFQKYYYFVQCRVLWQFEPVWNERCSDSKNISVLRLFYSIGFRMYWHFYRRSTNVPAKNIVRETIIRM